MKIVVAIDEHACATAALKFLSEQKRSSDLKIRLVYVVSPVMIDNPMSAYPLFLESIADEACQLGKELLEQSAKMIKASVDAEVDFRVSVGIPSHTIVQEAKLFTADLLLIGTHRRRGLDRFFAGSVSCDVAANAPCTVVTLPLVSVKISDAQQNAATSNALLTGA